MQKILITHLNFTISEFFILDFFTTTKLVFYSNINLIGLILSL